MRGKVQRLLVEKGFGFIKTNESSEDVFFHASGLKNCSMAELHEGQVIDFDEIKQTPKGARAEGIRPAED